ncbi:hypothetical protein [Brevibacillus sp. SYSU BS000544]|uniref:hypothetical protein n=1 Tax=Brevibacillus sp. SYSU BS000544 TaxID=3416443 RepID=UPI003CE54979
MKISFESPDGSMIENPSINDLRLNMIDNFPDFWMQGNGTATINYFDDEKSQRSLLILPNSEHGIYLKYLVMENRRVKAEWLSLENSLALKHTVECSDEWYASIGLFLPLEKAWIAIVEFLLSGERTDKINWINSEEMPEDSNW